MAELIPLLVHLTPPVACSPIRLDRFSPFFTRAEEFGLLRVRPARAYYYVFPLGKRDLTKLAYFFDFDYPGGTNPVEHLAPVTPEVGRWWQLGGLANRDARGDPVVTDEAGRWWQSPGPEPQHCPRLDAWQEEEAVV